MTQERTDRKTETLLAHLLGELPEDEQAKIEAELQMNPDLQSELESLKETLGQVGDWMDSDPPGLEALERLPIPEQKILSIQPTGWNPIAKLAAQAIAASLIFFLGYVFGQQTTGGPHPDPTSEVAQAPPTQSPSVEPNPELKPRRGHHRTYEENGRIIIETTLPASGGSAVWVVDGNFQLAGK
ncbi:MAG: hypothetical protein H6752_01175 [Candidatus Omnitrophica bacterium]|nr:hypothetical protein [Candidatus Omnitrophota bacterium]